VREEDALEKTNRINLLFDFYATLLTEKQRTFLSCYVHDDFSLGEIAAEFSISRQAVYEHIKRAEQTLEEYEQKLQLLGKHQRRTELFNMIAERLGSPDSVSERELRSLLESVRAVD
jgi:predicted DNA-binding protein YlxM (UPF0122 family)